MDPTRRWLQASEKIVLLVFFTAVFYSLTVPIFSPDFWWHLASGRWMWQSRTLMLEDPFGFVSFPSDSAIWRGLVLKQYWVSQLLFFGVHSIAGFKGILLLRAGALTLMFYLIYRLMRSGGAGPLLSFSLLYLSVIVVVMEFSYVEARPQMWTYLFTVLLINVLEKLKRGGRRWPGAALCALMLLWGNMHGGYVLGDVIIAIYLVSAAVSRTGGVSYYAFLALAMFLSGFNPNGFNAFASLFISFVDVETSAYWGAIIEEQSILRHASLAGIMRRLPHFSVLFLISLASFLLNVRHVGKMRKELLVLYALALIMGLSSIRYVVFFAIVAPIATAVNLREAAGRIATWGWVASRTEVTGKTLVLLALPLALLAAWHLKAESAGRSALRHTKPYVDDYGGAVNFIKQNRLEGKMFNDYEYGGYFIWWLSPDIKVFSDGRGLSYKGFELFRRVVKRPFDQGPSNTRLPLYISTFMRYGIDLVAISGCDKDSGVTIPLTYALLKDMAWAIVYADTKAIVFLKKTPANMPVIKRNALPKAAGYSNILSMATRASKGGHARMMPEHRLSRAIAYEGLGQKREALHWVNEYLRLRPGDPDALFIRGRIREMQ
jgi:hypothetical protein